MIDEETMLRKRSDNRRLSMWDGRIRDLEGSTGINLHNAGTASEISRDSVSIGLEEYKSNNVDDICQKMFQKLFQKLLDRGTSC